LFASHCRSRPSAVRPSLVLLLLALAGCLGSCAPPAGGSQQGETITRVVRPGVLHRSIRDPRGPWNIQVLEVDLRQGDLFFDTARSRDSLYGRETTSDMSVRNSDTSSTVIAALNADFFDMKTGESVNNQVAGGKIVRAVVPLLAGSGEYRGVRSQIAFPSAGKPLLDRFIFDGKVFWGSGGMSPIGGVNVIRARTDLVLLNSYFGRFPPGDTLPRGYAGLPLRVVGSSGDTVIVLADRSVRAPGSFRATHESPVLLSLNHPGLFDSVGAAPGDTLKLLLGFRPRCGAIRGLVGGIPRLVRNGVSCAGKPEYREGATEEFSAARHPRTGIGFSSDSTRVYLVTVDGRQSGSVGMSLPEFAALMISLGVAEGLNMDGGGSTTMVLGGRVVNSPSDAAGERPVANAVLLLERRKH
jgi:hypothetical protein